ncbi:hypothetical protein ABIB29_001214 [Arthrobacter sp. UYEF36]
MTSKLDGNLAVNTDSGTVVVTSFVEPTLAHIHARAPVPRQTAPPRELAA